MRVTLAGDKLRVKMTSSLASMAALVILGMVIACVTICGCWRGGREGFTDKTDIGWPVGPNPNAPYLEMLEKAKFAPECCPATYSNSMGCLCDKEKMQFINRRGGNRACCTDF